MNHLGSPSLQLGVYDAKLQRFQKIGDRNISLCLTNQSQLK
jgi:hypothetical protein